jgi:glycosyltransferase involved in cell wall biosynthesis
MAKKDINVITSLCGKGLEREYLLLKDLLHLNECYTNVYHYTDIANSNFVQADISIFLEVVMSPALHLSRENWIFPNPEWWNPINDRFLPQFSKVCCKTMDCYRIWCAKVGADKCLYTGFEARDLYDPTIPRENRFLHVAGESEYKNTEAVITAWKSGNWGIKPFPLTVVTRQKRYQDMCLGLTDDRKDRITLVHRADEGELKRLMNSHRFHILPSSYEGYGHAAHEGIGCGALMITTDAPPMSEFGGIMGDWKVPCVNKSPRALAQLAMVNFSGVMVAAMKAVSAATNLPFLERKSQEARQAFLTEREAFRKRFLTLVGVA